MIKVKLLILFAIFFGSVKTYAQDSIIQWQKTFGGSSFEQISSIIPTKDKGYIGVGLTVSSDHDISKYHGGYSDVWVIKLDSTGKLEWEKTYGGTGDDIGNTIKETSDGYIVIGSTGSQDGDITSFNGGDADFWVLKLKNDGTIIWQKTYGGSGRDIGQSIIQTHDKRFIATGFTYSSDKDIKHSHGKRDGWILKIDSIGGMVWQKTYGGSEWDYFYSITSYSDSGYFLTGVSMSQDGDLKGVGTPDGGGWILKLKKDTIIEWQKTDSNVALSSVLNSDSDLVVTGIAVGNSNLPWIAKFNKSGKIKWKWTFAGASPFPLGSYAISLCNSPNGGYLIAGRTDSKGGIITKAYGKSDIWIIKADSTGAVEWQKTYGGSSDDGNNDYIGGGYYGAFGNSSITPTYDGGYIFCGYTFSNDHDVSSNYGGGDAWVVKLRPDTSIHTSLEPQNTILECFLYPNPVNSTLHFVLSPLLKGDRGMFAHLNITDISGRLVSTQNIISAKTEIDISLFQPGIYLIQYKDSESTWNGKFVKE